ncbi:MAG: hypothetical protein GX924_00700 [Clostridiaceae bacterium]|jgi:hypothetical protein|nr:hypothetical protein [Clostridiaceae bacterium]
MKIVWATASDSRPDIPTTHYLSEDAFDEVMSRLATLKIKERDDTLRLRTPSHTLTICAENTGLFAIVSYDDEDTTAPVYDGALYRIDDAAFSEYLGGVCSGQFSPKDLEELKTYFPKYFDLATAKGLEVYVWQTGHSSYSCALMTSGSGRDKPQKELCRMKGTTIAEMNQFKLTFGDASQMDHSWDEVPSFNKATADYDNLFFADNSLILSYIRSSSESFRYGVHDIVYDPSSFCMYISRTNNPDWSTDMMAGWFILVEMRDEDIRNCKSFDAQYVETPELPVMFHRKTDKI